MALVFVDVETTGLDPDRHSIWDVAYAIEDGPVQSAIVPHHLDGADAPALSIGWYYARAARRTWDHLSIRDAMETEDAMRSALTGNTLVAANPAFDAAFLRKRWGAAPWKYRLLDVEAYAMPHFGWDAPHGLKDIAENLGVESPDHTAATDVHVLRQCFYKLRDIYQNGGTE